MGTVHANAIIRFILERKVHLIGLVKCCHSHCHPLPPFTLALSGGADANGYSAAFLHDSISITGECYCRRMHYGTVCVDKLL